MKLYVPLPIEPFRRETFPLLKPFFGKDGMPKDVWEREGLDFPFSLTDPTTNGSTVILPMSWNYYTKKGELQKITHWFYQNREKKYQVLSFLSGDYGVKVPLFENLKVLRSNGQRSRWPENHQGLPAFISDPLQKYFSGHWSPCPHSEQPKIGFCGMANGTISYAFEELFRIAKKNFKYRVGLSKQLPQPWMPTSLRRAQLLKRLEASSQLQTQFIYRKKYRAGAQTEDARKKTAFEFYRNIVDNQYVLCFRGVGNFSIRFYETLAMGRIPIFVNTDCLLPLPDLIPWKEHVVWVDYHERYQIAEKVWAFHSKLTPSSLLELQKRNRQLWEHRLTLEGFFKTFLKHLP